MKQKYVELSVSILNAMNRAGLHSLEDVADYGIVRFGELRGIGSVNAKRVRKLLIEHGFADACPPPHSVPVFNAPQQPKEPTE